MSRYLMKYVGTYPERVAAAVSICGGGDINDACNLTQVPIKVIPKKYDNVEHKIFDTFYYGFSNYYLFDDT